MQSPALIEKRLLPQGLPAHIGSAMDAALTGKGKERATPQAANCAANVYFK